LLEIDDGICLNDDDCDIWSFCDRSDKAIAMISSLSSTIVNSLNEMDDLSSAAVSGVLNAMDIASQTYVMKQTKVGRRLVVVYLIVI
jgi:hypothetical protein